MWVGFGYGYGCWDWDGIRIGVDFLKSKIWGKIFGANCGPGFGILPVGVYGRGITPPRGGGKGMAMFPVVPQFQSGFNRKYSSHSPLSKRAAIQNRL